MRCQTSQVRDRGKMKCKGILQKGRNQQIQRLIQNQKKVKKLKLSSINESIQIVNEIKASLKKY